MQTVQPFIDSLRAMGYNSANLDYDTTLKNRIGRIPF
jgi:hypothetical protein